MITLQTTITHTEERTLNIEAPAFWKEPSMAFDSYRAVLDEKTYIQILRFGEGTDIRIQHSEVEGYASAIIQAQEKWIPITEQEFMQVYDDAWESMRLQPKHHYAESKEKTEAIQNAVTL